MKICFAASGGGHLRQILQLNRLWHLGDCFFVSEDSILFHSFEGPARRYVVTSFAIGELQRRGKLGALWRICRNFCESLRHVYAERPDVVITTGAGSVFFLSLFSRLAGAKVVVVETFARSKKLSRFARFAGLFANQRVLQAQSLSRFWPGVPVFEPLQLCDAPQQSAKKDLILVTVGATLPFDRMVQAMETLVRSGSVRSEVVYQIGRGGRRPAGAVVFEELPVRELHALLARAKIVVCHGGTGSVVPALEAGCHVIAFARQQHRGEHFDDHQGELTTLLESKGLIRVAADSHSLQQAIDEASRSAPAHVTTDMSQLNDFLAALLSKWFALEIRG